jgi:hypothetical protein
VIVDLLGMKTSHKVFALVAVKFYPTNQNDDESPYPDTSCQPFPQGKGNGDNHLIAGAIANARFSMIPEELKNMTKHSNTLTQGDNGAKI